MPIFDKSTSNRAGADLLPAILAGEAPRYVPATSIPYLSSTATAGSDEAWLDRPSAYRKCIGVGLS